VTTTERSVVIGVAGGSGSGKTTVVQRLLDRVGRDRVAVLHHDRYYRDLSHLPMADRRGTNMDHPEAFDDELFLEHLRALVAGDEVGVPRYDYASWSRLPGADTVRPAPVVLVEGILLFASPLLRETLDVKVFVDADADLRLLRRLRRDVAERGRTTESVLDQYEATVRPMHLRFVEPSKRWADVIVPRGGHNDVAVGLVAARVTELLSA
jgi:uridine kinase